MKIYNSICLVLTIMIMMSSIVLSQEIKDVKQKSDDAFRELSEKELSLRFFDALTGKPIPDASVKIEGIGEYKTDFEGRAFFANPDSNGVFKVKFAQEKYIKSEFEIELMAGTLFFNRFSISPLLPIGSLRAVLDWGENPKDLDAHLVKPGSYHISYRDMITSSDGIARLDRDDTDGFGPETITANTVDPNAEYVFYVHDFTNKNNSSSGVLSNSKASVKVYGGNNELLEVFKIPQNKKGTKWNVFKIVHGQVVPVNEIE